MSYIDKLLNEWAYRVHDGKPNPKNIDHIWQLRDILLEWEWDVPAINQFVYELKEAKRRTDGEDWELPPDSPSGDWAGKNQQGKIEYFSGSDAKAKAIEWAQGGKDGEVEDDKTGTGGNSSEEDDGGDGVVKDKEKEYRKHDLDDEEKRIKLYKSFEKQKEKRRAIFDKLLKQAETKEQKDALTEVWNKVELFYDDVLKYLSESDHKKRKKLGEQLFKKHNIAVNKVIEGDNAGDDQLKFYHNDIYGNKELEKTLGKELYNQVRDGLGKIVPPSTAGHKLAFGLEKDGIKVKDPSDMAMTDYKKQKKQVEKLEKRDRKNREALKGGYEVLEQIKDKYPEGEKSPQYIRAKAALDKQKARNKELEKETSVAKRELKKHKMRVRSALTLNTRRTSKPEMGPQRKEIKEDGTPDPVIEGVMGSPPLDGITRNEDGTPNSMSGLFGPVDDDDNLISASDDEGKRKHFEYSVEQNDSLDDTIEELERQRDLGVVGQEIVDTVQGHKDRMKDILRRTKLDSNDPDYLEYPSEEAAREISKSYRDMFNELASYKTAEGTAIMDGHGSKEWNKQPGKSIITNIAEQALYDTELAAGDEVYLPSAGTFPGGDKVKVTTEGDADNEVHRVESISVKVGDSGKFYGFPGETKQYQKYHPDRPDQREEGEPSYKDRHRNNSGEPGFATGIDDRLLSEPKYFNKMLEESGLSDAIRDPEKLRETLDTMSKCIAGKTASEGKTTPKNKKEVQKCVSAANAQLSELLDPEKLEELVGPNNAKLILGGGEDAALFFTNMVSFGAIIGTSEGLKGLSHNHMDMETHEQHTEPGSSNLKDYNFMFRHGESSRNGGLTAGLYREQQQPDEVEPKVS